MPKASTIMEKRGAWWALVLKSSLLCHILLPEELIPCPVRDEVSSRFVGSTGKGHGARGKADAAIKLHRMEETRWERHICQQPGDIGLSQLNTLPK